LKRKGWESQGKGERTKKICGSERMEGKK